MTPTPSTYGSSAGERLKVFISYSRRDASEFADELAAGLELAGVAPFLDRHDIAPGEDWEARLGGLIGESDTVVFVISPESVNSERCVWEVERAYSLSKRTLPVVYKAVPDADIPRTLSRLQFIRFDSGRGLARPLTELAASLRLDIEWIRNHTRLGELAARWYARGRPESLLLRGDELDAAKVWQVERMPAAPEITETQRAFLTASEKTENERVGKELAQLEAMRIAQAATARSQKVAARRLWGVAVLMIASFAYVLLQSYNVARREVAVFSDFARQAMEQGHFDRAMRYALQAYPARGHLPFLTPFSTELEGQLAGGAQSSRLHRILRGHSRQLKSAAFTPDGSRILTGSDDGTARVWNVESGSPLVLVKTEDARPLSSVTLSPDGTRILASSADAAARIWDVETGKELIAFIGHAGFVNSVAFDSIGRRVATVSRDKTARIWDAYTGQELLVLTGHSTESAGEVSFSASGGRLLTIDSEEGTARVWDAASGKQIAFIRSAESMFWRGMLDHDGRRVLLTELFGAVRIFEVDTGNELAKLADPTNTVIDAVFDRSGKRVLASAQDIRIWDSQTGQELAALKAPRGATPREASFDRAEQRVFANYSDGFTRVWDVQSGKVTIEIKTDAGTSVRPALSFDGKRLFSGSDNATARIWLIDDAASILTMKGHSGSIYRAAYSRDGQRAVTASADGTARIWDVVSGRQLVKLEGHGSPVLSARFDDSGRRVVTTSLDVRIWDADTGASITVLKGHDGRIESASFDPAGNRVVSAGSDGTARIWDVRSGALLATQKHPGWIRSAEFSPDGRWITTSTDREFGFVWDAQTLKLIATLEGHTSAIRDARFDTAGKRVLTASLDGTVRIWDALSGKELKRLGNGVYSSAWFNPEETRVVAGARDGAHILDVESGTQIAKMGNEVTAVAFSPDGVHVLVAERDGIAYILKATWAISLRGTSLRERVCAEKLMGVAQEFTDAELDNPVLRDIDPADPIARNPCLRRGPLSFDYWKRLPGTLLRVGHSLFAREALAVPARR